MKSQSVIAACGSPTDLKSLARGDTDLVKVLEKHLTNKFVEVASLRRMQMRLRVYATKEVHKSIVKDSIVTAAENTGIGRIVANKGGLSVRFAEGATTLCFISTHLNAHEGLSR